MTASDHPNCAHCHVGTLVEIKGHEPHTVDHWQCDKCDSTYAELPKPPSPTLSLEQRPSHITGIAFWLSLRYKEHVFDAILPEGFMGWDDTARDLAIAKIGGELKAKLRPILLAEDRSLRLVTA